MAELQAARHGNMSLCVIAAECFQGQMLKHCAQITVVPLQCVSEVEGDQEMTIGGFFDFPLKSLRLRPDPKKSDGNKSNERERREKKLAHSHCRPP